MNYTSVINKISIFLVVMLVAFRSLLFNTQSNAMRINDDSYLFSPTPPMGWNPWNSFGCYANEKEIINSASMMKNLGLVSAGYNTLVIDDCWMSGIRNSKGDLVANSEKFPHGINYVVNYLHSLGMKIGIYASPGKNTCKIRNGGSEGHYQEDARLFVKWGIDFLKFDLCKSDQNIRDQISYFSHMRYALLNALSFRRKKGLPGSSTLVYSINPNSLFAWKPTPRVFINGTLPPGMRYHWGSISDSWRISLDLIPVWHNSYYAYEHQGISDVIRLAMKSIHLGLSSHNNHWMNLGMLEIGNGKLTFTENKTHFLMWALFSSPLFLGFDFSKVSKNILELVKNQRIIAIDQSPPIGTITFLHDDSFLRKLPSNLGKYVIVQYNETGNVKKIETQLPGPKVKFLTEVFSGKTKKFTSNTLSSFVEPHGVVSYIVNYRH